MKIYIALSSIPFRFVVLLRTGLVALLLMVATMVAAEVQRYEQALKIGDLNLRVKVPQGYVFEYLTGEMKRPRMLSFMGDRMLVGSRSGEIYQLDPPYRQPHRLADLDGYPHSVVARDQEILVARTQGVYRAPYRRETTALDEDDFNLLAALPGGGGHNSRTLRIGPDGRLYLSLGIRGNCSDEYLHSSYPPHRQRGGVLVLNEQAKEHYWEVFASGLRNPVGFGWHPETGVMYASNNGPDHSGYDKPVESFARLEAGSFHGMPWFQYDGQKLYRDTCVDSKPPRPQAAVAIPEAYFPARNAPMAVAFVPQGALGKQFFGDAVVALHGSWGTLPDGSGSGHPATRREPKLVLVRFEQGHAIKVEDFVTGFQLTNGRRWARPMGLAFGPDGHLYMSSDSQLQGLYRLRRKE